MQEKKNLQVPNVFPFVLLLLSQATTFVNILHLLKLKEWDVGCLGNCLACSSQ